MNPRFHVLMTVPVMLLAQLAAMAEEGEFVFSKTPIDPSNPRDLTSQFQAGDHIYGLIRLPRTWRTMGNAVGEDKLVLAVYTVIDSKRLAAYMELRTDGHLDAKHLLFDVAPELNHMTAYRDDGVFYGDAPGGIKKGACQITEHLAQQRPGDHVLSFLVLLKGQKLAAGECRIAGDDYSLYQTIHDGIKSELSSGRAFPAAQSTNKAMEQKMLKLLEDAGWSKVLKLHIVDKDWWLDRIAGGNSMIQSRHMAAAAAYQDDDGKYFYKICTFHEHRLLSGGFGPLELTHQSEPIGISAKSLGVTAPAKDAPDMSGVAEADQPDFSQIDAVLADLERMRQEAMKKRAFVLVGKCSGAATKIKSIVEKDPQGSSAEIQRVWLEVYAEFKKIQ